jgi:serine/threonine protein kinase
MATDSAELTADRWETPNPTHIGRYRILGPLGAGGMGKVFKAHDPQLDRVVALKLPHFEGAPDKRQQRLQRFQREARTAAQVWHTNVCPLYDVGEQDGQPYVVMAYIEGRSLEDVLKKQGRFEEVGEAVALVLQVLDGLEAIHAAGLVHRDVKPSNILIDLQGRAIVVDFGLARTDQEGEGLTSDGVIVGTPSYMAPEQAGGRADQIGPWTDLYSLGVVFYRMVTGRLPHEGPPLAVLGRIQNEAVPPPSQFRPDLQRNIESILLKALAKEPVARFPNARQFADAFRGSSVSAVQRDQAATSATQPELTTNHPKSRPVHPRKFRVWMQLIVAGVGCVIVGLGFLMAQSMVGLGEKNNWLTGTDVLPPPLGAFGVLWLLAAIVCLVQSLGKWVIHSPPRLLSAAANLTTGHGLNSTQYALHLLQDGVPVDCRDALGETPLMKAAQCGNVEMVKLLLLWGADVRLENQFGQTSFVIAVSKNHRDVAELLKHAAARE